MILDYIINLRENIFNRFRNVYNFIRKPLSLAEDWNSVRGKYKELERKIDDYYDQRMKDIFQTLLPSGRSFDSAVISPNHFHFSWNETGDERRRMSYG